MLLVCEEIKAATQKNDKCLLIWEQADNEIVDFCLWIFCICTSYTIAPPCGKIMEMLH